LTGLFLLLLLPPQKQTTSTMKKILALGFILSLTFACSQPKTESDKAIIFQKNLNKEFTNEKSSPLPKDAIKSFKELDFFPVNEQYIIEAELIPTPDEKPFEMQTTTARKPIYIKYGEVHFTLNGKKQKLDVFQDISIREKEEYKKHLFLPFTDLTSGLTTYGGGRYLDLEIPSNNVLILNFNMAYNPYCVYNPKFSCPIPPEQNFIDAEINAGIKDYKYE
jgi:uncharacterized protein (DUF1684 family)